MSDYLERAAHLRSAWCDCAMSEIRNLKTFKSDCATCIAAEIQKAVAEERERQAVAYLARHLCHDHKRESATTGGAYPGEGRSCIVCERAVEYAAVIRERK